MKEVNGNGEELSKREREVMKLIGVGLNYREVAEKLFISSNTVKTHLQHIYSKLKVNNKIAAIKKTN